MIRQVVFESNSFTDVARRHDIHPGTITRWIDEFAQQLPAHTDFNITTILNWSGSMVLDGKELSLPGDSHCCYKAEYDELVKDIAGYISSKLKIKILAYPLLYA